MRIAIMQPYFMPYLGYFHLLDAVDLLVLYDDVEYTKKGWINRNRLLLGGGIETVTVPLERSRDSAPIGARRIAGRWPQQRAKYTRKIKQDYRARPAFAHGMDVWNQIVGFDERDLYPFLHHNVAVLASTLGVETQIVRSSTIGDFTAYRGDQKVKAICHALNAANYVNAIGGQALYDRAEFAAAGIDLAFVESNFPAYDQPGVEFVPGLSALDLTFSISDPTRLREQVGAYRLV